MRQLTIIILLAAIVVGCDESEVAPKTVQLDYFTEAFDMPGLGFQPQSKTSYEYDNTGKLTRYRFFGFEPTASTLIEQRHFDFTYTDGNLEKIEGFLTDATTPYIKYTYQYNGAKVAKITENNYAAGINSEAVFSSPTSTSIKVAYTFSNGGSFEYEFVTDGLNIVSDKTTRGAQLCSDGEYTYDQHPNPFKTLGYVDYLQLNVSSNNRLTEEVNYVGCAFPTLIPESYEYTYNSDGYPVEVTTKYKSNDVMMKSVKKFYYKTM